MSDEVSFKKRKNRGATHARGRPNGSTTNSDDKPAATTSSSASEPPKRTVTITDANDDDDNDTASTTTPTIATTTAATSDGVARTSVAVEDEFEIPDEEEENNMDASEPSWRRAAAEAVMASNAAAKELLEPNEDNEDDDDNDNNDTRTGSTARGTKRARDTTAATASSATDDNDNDDTNASAHDDTDIPAAAAAAAEAASGVSGGNDDDDNDNSNGGNESSEASRMKKFRESAKERLNKRLKKDANPLVQSTRDRLKKGIEVVSVASKRSAAPDKSTQEHKVAVEIDQAEKPKKGKDGQAKWLGPIRVAANTRNISRFDYQPNLCKDYNETGYCSFGDACKFHHDRGDYKSGWELEKEWKAEQELKKKRAMGEYVEDEPDYRVDQEEQFPFACHICRNDFTTPIVTRCKHYFCEKCAVQRYARDTKCAVCNEQTHGLFSTAHKLISFLKKKAAGTLPSKKDDTGPHANHTSGRQSGEGWLL